MLKRFAIKYSFEFVVIILGILVSLLLEQRRQNEIEIDRKNNTIKQLINVIYEANLDCHISNSAYFRCFI